MTKKSIGIALDESDHAVITKIRSILIEQEAGIPAASWTKASRSRIVRFSLRLALEELRDQKNGDRRK